MVCGMTYYQILWYFLIYSFLGWIVEVVFHAVTLGKVINRGFLNGPLCPVYGFGVVLVFSCANQAESAGLIALRQGNNDWQSIVILIAGGMILATLVELIAGALLDICFHMRWWDYSDKPFNFHGYICLEFSIFWGLGIAMIVRMIQPVMEKSSDLGIPTSVGWPLLAVLYLLAAVDFGVTVAVIIGLNRRLAQLDELQKKLRIVSNKMSDTIGTNTIAAAQAIEEGQVQAALAKAEIKTMAAAGKDRLTEAALGKKTALTEAALEKKTALTEAALEKKTALTEAALGKKEELTAQINSIIRSISGSRFFGAGRMLRAFPRLTHRVYEETLKELRKRMSDE